MSTITNGTVEFERVTRPADFESKRVRVTLSYAVDDGEDPVAAASRVGDMAHAEVFRMLAKAEKGSPAAAAKPPRVETPRPTQSPASDAPTEPAAVDAAGTTSDATSAPAAESPSSSTPANVTDAELQAACQRARARGCTPDQLKAEIAKMVPQPGMRIIHITDPAGRAKALATVDALQPVAAGGSAADAY